VPGVDGEGRVVMLRVTITPLKGDGPERGGQTNREHGMTLRSYGAAAPYFPQYDVGKGHAYDGVILTGLEHHPLSRKCVANGPIAPFPANITCLTAKCVSSSRPYMSTMRRAIVMLAGRKPLAHALRE
jgi:hypothetical protein